MTVSTITIGYINIFMCPISNTPDMMLPASRARSPPRRCPKGSKITICFKMSMFFLSFRLCFCGFHFCLLCIHVYIYMMDKSVPFHFFLQGIQSQQVGSWAKNLSRLGSLIFRLLRPGRLRLGENGWLGLVFVEVFMHVILHLYIA